jgi:CRP/FNR family transcriptional regulator, cyclic AMP receptor protein
LNNGISNCPCDTGNTGVSLGLRFTTKGRNVVVIQKRESRGANDAALAKTLAALPTATYGAGEAVLTAGSKTGQLLILKSGTVAILKGSIEIARVSESGAVIGELSALLDQPHTADVRSLEDSQFYVADAALLERDPVAVLHIARILARRLVAIDDGFVELKKQLEVGQSPGVLGRTIERIEKTLSAWSEDAPALTPGWRGQP